MFLCAEDDDLELVSLVHRAQEERIGVEVLPGVDREPEAVLDEFEGRERNACVLFCSKGFSPSDALGFRKRFQARFPTDELIVMEIDRSRVDAHLEVLSRRLARARAPKPELREVDDSADVEPIAPNSDPDRDPDPDPDRVGPPKLPRVVLGLVALTGVAFAAWTLLSPTESTKAPSKVSTSAQAAAPPKPAPVDAEQDGTPPMVEPHEAPISPNLALLRETLGKDEPLLKGLTAGQIDAAALIVTAAGSGAPCASLQKGEAALRRENPALLAALLRAQLELPTDCGAAQPAEGSTPLADAPREARRRPSRPSPKRRPETPGPRNPDPSEKAGTAEADAKQSSKPKARARLIDDGLIQTTE